MKATISIHFRASVYKYIYFVESSTGLLNAIFDGVPDSVDQAAAFEVTITGTTEKYSTYLFTGDVSTLVTFDNLIGIPIEQKMAKTDYAAVETIIKQAWLATSAGK